MVFDLLNDLGLCDDACRAKKDSSGTALPLYMQRGFLDQLERAYHSNPNGGNPDVSTELCSKDMDRPSCVFPGMPEEGSSSRLLKAVSCASPKPTSVDLCAGIRVNSESHRSPGLRGGRRPIEE